MLEKYKVPEGLDYEAWKAHVTSQAIKMGGSPTFNGTRLTIAHIASLAASEDGCRELLEDYPYLTEQDLRFCVRYVEEL